MSIPPPTPPTAAEVVRQKSVESSRSHSFKRGKDPTDASDHKRIPRESADASAGLPGGPEGGRAESRGSGGAPYRMGCEAAGRGSSTSQKCHQGSDKRWWKWEASAGIAQEVRERALPKRQVDVPGWFWTLVHGGVKKQPKSALWKQRPPLMRSMFMSAVAAAAEKM